MHDNFNMRNNSTNNLETQGYIDVTTKRIDSGLTSKKRAG